jgi:hypothetical protein
MASAGSSMDRQGPMQLACIVVCREDERAMCETGPAVAAHGEYICTPWEMKGQHLRK